MIRCNLCSKQISEKDNWIRIKPVRLNITLDGESNKEDFTLDDFHLDCGIIILSLMSGNRGGRFDYRIVEEKIKQNW